MNPKNFFAELKRRHVYRVAVAYAVVAWLAIQVAATVVPALLLPGLITSAVVFAAILGFPAALILAWAFELTPEGIKRTDEAGPDESVSRRTGRKITALIVIAAIAAAGLFAWQLFRKRATSDADKSIAVLPFQNLSGDKENAYFADGVQDEILTTLAKVADLKVISRTSVMQYRENSSRKLPEIAEALQVAHVLEGSVQRVGNRVRVTAQLIDARNDRISGPSVTIATWRTFSRSKARSRRRSRNSFARSFRRRRRRRLRRNRPRISPPMSFI